MAVTSVLIVLGLGFWVWAGYEYMSAEFGNSAGAFGAGVIALIEAGVVIWIIHLLHR